MSGPSGQQEYDVIVVGSGAGGGMSALILSIAGLKVLMLEAGRHYDPVTETPMFNLPKDAPLRGASTPDKPFGFYDATVDGGWQVPGEPYTQASREPQQRFDWWRARMLGGRTNHWGRISLRNGEYDFKPYSRDGLGLDWPINYADLAPYYDKTEMLIGVYGETGHGLENTPDSPEGILQPAPKPRAYELLAKKSCDELKIPVIPAHLAILSQRQDHTRLPAKLFPHSALGQKVVAASMQSRAACFWATPCGRGCSIKANFQSTTVLIPPALATGNLTIITDAMVREVTLNSAGKADGVIYIDKNSRQEVKVKGRAVVVAASAAETARIFLNSRSPLFPDGIANSSGLVGKYLMDTVGAGVSGQIPALENLPPMNEDGSSGMHLYQPWWLYKQQKAGKMNFARGYHIEMSGGRGMPGAGAFGGLQNFTEGAYGAEFKQACRRYYGTFVHFAGRGEMIPNENSYAELDPTVVDQWGIPVLKFHWQWSEHEINQAAHMHKTFADIITGMGGKVTSSIETDGRNAIASGGSIIHEVGGTIMGADRKKSVLNQHCQAWDVPNLFVTDGAPFASNADKNPTLTILALAWRTSDYIVEQFKQRNI
ncbi:GMC oxidoreductase [Rheinheimera sp.]|uniref:GMC oxidoreductase n=1 Tax=Rheinheimera sp. TaxID=1869214 RepID=UPI0027359017|nr:GMC family oxidoreductase [Rheinheimera sp.]MDP2716631.1 GMC family oxidoreductase [Rheinheimera sp.]